MIYKANIYNMHHTYKTKAYTLLELIIVIIILTLLIWAFKWFMQNKNNKQIYFWKQCSQYIYQEIVTEINNLKRNKIENISGTDYSQIKKYIDINTNTININKTMTNILTNEEYETQRSIISENECLNKDIKNTNNYLITINQSGNLMFTPQGIHINDNNIFEINICIDTGNKDTCIPSSQIIFNQVAQTIDQKLCINFSWDTCNEWSK